MAWTSTEHPPAAAAEVQAACARRLPQRAGGHAPGLVFPSVPGPRPVHHGARRRELVTAEPNSSADQNSPCPPLLGGPPKRDPPHYAPRGCRRHPGGRLRGAPTPLRTPKAHTGAHGAVSVGSSPESTGRTPSRTQLRARTPEAPAPLRTLQVHTAPEGPSPGGLADPIPCPMKPSPARRTLPPPAEALPRQPNPSPAR